MRARNHKASKDFMTTVAHQETLEAIKERKRRIAAFEAEIFGSPFAPRRHASSDTRPPLSDEFVSLLLNAIRHSRGPSSFLTKLPVEIRLIIYGYLFDAVCPDTVRYIFYFWRENTRLGMSKDFPQGVSEPPMLRVCCQIRQEARQEYHRFMQARRAREVQEEDEQRQALTTGGWGPAPLCFGGLWSGECGD